MLISNTGALTFANAESLRMREKWPFETIEFDSRQSHENFDVYGTHLASGMCNEMGRYCVWSAYSRLCVRRACVRETAFSVELYDDDEEWKRIGPLFDINRGIVENMSKIRGIRINMPNNSRSTE